MTLDDSEADGSECSQQDTDVEDHDKLIAGLIEQNTPEEARAPVAHCSDRSDQGEETVVMDRILDIGFVVAGDQEHSCGCQQ